MLQNLQKVKSYITIKYFTSNNVKLVKNRTSEQLEYKEIIIFYVKMSCHFLL
jgi:hypothetical protein